MKNKIRNTEKRFKIILIPVLFTILMIVNLSCNSNDDDTTPQQNNYNAVVLRVGLDCGENYLIKFNSDVVGLPSNTSDNVFYEINLPSQYKVNGKQLNIDFRAPTDTEIMVCSSMDFAYPQIYIKSVK